MGRVKNMQNRSGTTAAAEAYATTSAQELDAVCSSR